MCNEWQSYCFLLKNSVFLFKKRIIIFVFGYLWRTLMFIAQRRTWKLFPASFSTIWYNIKITFRWFRRSFMRWNFSSKLTKLLFQADETLVSNRRNFSFKPQKLNVLPIETNQRYYQFKESIKRSHKDIIIPMLQINYLQQVSATL